MRELLHLLRPQRRGCASPQPQKVEAAAPVKQEAPAAPAATAAPATATTDGRIKASPLAKAMAKEQGIDLSTVRYW